MYVYADERKNIFTESGQVTFLKIRDNTKRLLVVAGACSADKMMQGVYGDSWTLLACIDRLVELKEIVEVTNPDTTWGQYRIFTTPNA